MFLRSRGMMGRLSRFERVGLIIIGGVLGGGFLKTVELKYHPGWGGVAHGGWKA